MDEVGAEGGGYVSEPSVGWLGGELSGFVAGEVGVVYGSEAGEFALAETLLTSEPPD